MKNATGIGTSKCAKKFDLASIRPNLVKLDIDKLETVPTNLNNLKSKVDKLDVDWLIPAPVALSELYDVVKNDDVYNSKIKDKIPDFTSLLTSDLLANSAFFKTDFVA